MLADNWDNLLKKCHCCFVFVANYARLTRLSTNNTKYRLYCVATDAYSISGRFIK